MEETSVKQTSALVEPEWGESSEFDESEMNLCEECGFVFETMHDLQ